MKGGGAQVLRLRRAIRLRQHRFFDLFEAATANAANAAELLDQMLASYPDHHELARAILICEQDGDRITREIIQRVDRTLIAPLGREDIRTLASALDDIVDLIEEVADYLGLYKVEAPMEQAQQLAHVLRQATSRLAQAMPRLRSFGDMSSHTAELNKLENDGDRITRDAVASLFEYDEIDPLLVIRWKDLFERLEAAIDATERVAYLLSGIVSRRTL